MTSYFLNLRTRVLHTEDCPHKPRNAKRVPIADLDAWLRENRGSSFDPRCRATQQQEGRAA